MTIFKKKILSSIGLFLIIQGQLFPQNTNNEKCFNCWNYGYVILKGSKEKIYGFIRTKGTWDIKAVKFRKDLRKSKNTIKAYKNDTIQYFGYCNKNYKWVNYTDTNYRKKTHIIGWMPVQEQGKITLCNVRYKLLPTKDSSTTSNTISWELKKKQPTVYYLNKEAEKDILLWDEFIDDDSVLSEKSKKILLNLIADNIDLYEEWKLEKIRFNDVLQIVHEYNRPGYGSENVIKNKSQQEMKSENSNSGQNQIIKHSAKPHNGFQCSIYLGETKGDVKINREGIENARLFNIGYPTYFAVSIGYIKNKWAAGFIFNYNSAYQFIDRSGINDTLYKKIEYLDNTFNGIYIKKYFMPVNVFVSTEVGFGHFLMFDSSVHAYHYTNYGFAWNVKVGKEFLIGKRKKTGVGGYINLMSIRCKDKSQTSSDIYSYFAPGIGFVMSFN